MENTIDFVRILRRLIQKIWLIILVTVVSGLLGIVYTIGDTPNIYNAQVSLYSVASGSYTASIQGSYAMRDYAEIVRSKKVAERVVNVLTDYDLNALTIQSMVSTSYDENSAIFYIFANSQDPKLANAVANAAADAFVIEVSNITGADRVKILDAADNVSISYDGVREQQKTRLIFVAAGFILICLILSLLEIFSSKIKSVNDSTLNGQIKLLGVIPKHNI